MKNFYESAIEEVEEIEREELIIFVKNNSCVPLQELEEMEIRELEMCRDDILEKMKMEEENHE